MPPVEAMSVDAAAAEHFEREGEFKLAAGFDHAGDQPQAIAELINGQGSLA